MSDWKLKDCYLIVDMERLDYDDYFQYDFKCPDLDDFFTQIKTTSNIFQNKDNVNEFFQKLLDFKNLNKSFYIRLKWLAYLHSVIANFKHNSLMFTFTMKALHIYLEKLNIIEKNYGPYELYLVNYLLRPYLQYLIKLCMLNMEDEIDKQNFINNSSIEYTKWYREYNFIYWTRQTFHDALASVKSFFSIRFPYLNKIGAQIYSDIRKIIGNLKKRYKDLGNLNVSLMELDTLEEKIINFQQQQLFAMTQEGGFLCSQVKDFSKAQLTQFFMSPLKINMTSASITNSSPFLVEQN